MAKRLLLYPLSYDRATHPATRIRTGDPKGTCSSAGIRHLDNLRLDRADKVHGDVHFTDVVPAAFGPNLEPGDNGSREITRADLGPCARDLNPR